MAFTIQFQPSFEFSYETLLAAGLIGPIPADASAAVDLGTPSASSPAMPSPPPSLMAIPFSVIQLSSPSTPPAHTISTAVSALPKPSAPTPSPNSSPSPLKALIPGTYALTISADTTPDNVTTLLYDDSTSALFTVPISINVVPATEPAGLAMLAIAVPMLTRRRKVTG